MANPLPEVIATTAADTVTESGHGGAATHLQPELFGLAPYQIVALAMLVLAALGLAVVFGLMGVINMAHGEFMTIGAYTVFLGSTLAEAVGAVGTAYYFPLAILAAFVLAFVAGWLLEWALIRHLYKRPLDTLLATWGVSLALQQAFRTFIGPKEVSPTLPDWLMGSWAPAEGLDIPINGLFVLGLAVVATAGVLLPAVWGVTSVDSALEKADAFPRATVPGAVTVLLASELYFWAFGASLRATSVFLASCSASFFEAGSPSALSLAKTASAAGILASATFAAASEGASVGSSSLRRFSSATRRSEILAGLLETWMISRPVAVSKKRTSPNQLLETKVLES